MIFFKALRENQRQLQLRVEFLEGDVQRLMAEVKTLTRQEGKSDHFCTFCGKGNREVQKLIAGPKVLRGDQSVMICEECIALCTDIIAENGGAA
ncbi:ClpX C4-type zinc finger protein [Falsirhodobacter halotolerans]|uniref:ClpX C4-type zinc finger protein n=1 Tax=Falsirhodobacter halotolerans TaxID=1146892 RepID=UPI001FD5178E|nr:ClpX C4-type zinc finger protein [Falsirhodobacter halotolerans]MCJ8138581.1 hypothetical protein [Falsirhodobacter halotolerans]